MAHLCDCLRSDRVDKGEKLVERAILLVVELHTGSPVHARRDTLERECNLPLQLAFSSRELVLRKTLTRQFRQLFANRVRGRFGSFRRSADVDAVIARIPMKRLEGVYRVCKAEVFAHPLEQARAHSASEKHPDKAQRMSSIIA